MLHAAATSLVPPAQLFRDVIVAAAEPFVICGDVSARADRALYAVKGRGRNGVSVSTSRAETPWGTQ